MISIRRTLALTTLTLAAATSFAQSSFTSPHMLEGPDKTLLGIGWDLRWGHGMTYPSPTNPHAPVSTMLLSPYGNAGVFRWLSLFMDDGTPVRAVMNTRRLGKNPGIRNLIYSEMEPIEVVFPRCDVDSKEPGGIEVSFRSDGGTASPLYDAKGLEVESALYRAKKQKMWLPANFRIKIGDLPCTRVNKVDALAIKQKFADLNGDGKEDMYYDVEELNFTLPVADATRFQEAFRATREGKATDLPVQLDYLTEDGQSLVTITWITNIASVKLADPYGDSTDPSAQAQVTAMLQKQRPCQVKVKWGTLPE